MASGAGHCWELRKYHVHGVMLHHGLAAADSSECDPFPIPDGGPVLLGTRGRSEWRCLQVPLLSSVSPHPLLSPSRVGGN